MKSIHLFHNGKQYKELLDDKGNVVKRTPTIDINIIHETIPPELIEKLGYASINSISSNKLSKEDKPMKPNPQINLARIQSQQKGTDELLINILFGDKNLKKIK